jgi:fimbrial isopeptide formation D2 family protein/LPXTG-motif cell wall-anchored protein
MTRFLSIVLTAVMTLAMIITAIPAIPTAAETATYKITIKGDDVADGHTYEAYQIFSADSATKNSGSDELKLNNIKWTTNTTAEKIKGFITEVKGNSEFGGSGSSNWFSDITVEATDYTAEQFAKIMVDKFPVNATAKTNVLAEIANKYFATTAAGTSEVSGKDAVISGLSAGYYLVKDQDNSLAGTNKVYSKYMMQVVGDTTVNAKAGKTSLSKEVSNTLDKTYTEGVQASVGDTVYFKLTATLPNYTADYKSYKLVFKDTLSEGLTYSQIESAYITDGTEETALGTSDYTVATTTSDGKTVLTIRTVDLKTVDSNLQYGDTVVIKYSAVLNEKAVFGNDGNINSAVLYYTNDPYDTGIDDKGNPTNPDDPGKGGETPEDHAYVFTYKVDVTKVDRNNTSATLGGAKFKVYKETTGSGSTKKEYLKKTTADGKTTVSWTETEADGYEFTSSSASDTKGQFSIEGLAAGTYYLVETEAPSGYAKLTEPIKFQIIATVTNEPDKDKATTTALSMDVAGSQIDSTDANLGTVAMTVKNGADGQTLPETGGIGTTIFYIVGGILVVGAALIVIVRKRMSMEE